jgi:pyruvate formate lyase activating enzyme
MLKDGRVDYEFRATVVPGFVEAEDLPRIGELASGGRTFVFQQFVPDDTLDKTFTCLKPHPPETIAKFADVMSKYVGNVTLRI